MDCRRQQPSRLAYERSFRQHLARHRELARGHRMPLLEFVPPPSPRRPVRIVDAVIVALATAALVIAVVCAWMR